MMIKKQLSTLILVLCATTSFSFDVNNMETKRWYSINPKWDFLPSVENAPEAKFQNRNWCNMVTNPHGGVLFYEGFYDKNRGTSIYANTLYNFNPVSEVCSMLSIEENSPISRHTYNQFCFANSTNSVYLFSGAHRGGVSDAWAYSLTTRSWTKILSNVAGGTDFHDCPTMWDPASNTISYFIKDKPYDVRNYNIATKAWIKLPAPANAGSITHHGTGNDYDTKRKRMIIFGGYWKHPSNTMRVYYPAQNKYEVIPVSGSKPPTPPADPHPPYSNIAYLHEQDVYLTVESGQTWVFNPNANTWTKLSPSGSTPPDFNMRLAYDKVNNVIVGLELLNFDARFWIFRYEENSSVSTVKKAVQSAAGIMAWPNPFKSSIKIALSYPALAGSAVSKVSVSIFHVTGKLIHNLIVPPGRDRQLKAGITWNATHLPPGIYLAKVTVGNRVYTKHLIMMK